MLSACETAIFKDVSSSLLLSIIGTLHCSAIFFAVILSPKASITSGSGPIKMMLFCAQRLANSEFSDKNP